jgi:TetR/AcrR family transcriptional repressor of nem operon
VARPKEFCREEALDKAMRLFWRKGYEATSMRDLTEAMGIKRQSLYDTYGGKHALFLAALDHFEEAQVLLVQDLLVRPGSAREALGDFFEIIIEDVAGQRRDGCFMVNSTIEMAVPDKEVARRVVASKERMEMILQQLVRRGQAQGEFSERQDPLLQARMIFNSILGLRVMAKVTDDPEVMRGITEGLLASLA